MKLVLIAFALLLLGGLAAPLCGKRDSAAANTGMTAGLLACIAGLAGAVALLCGLLPVETQELGKSGLSLTLDPLSAMFLLPVFIAGIPALIHAKGYLAGHAEGRTGWFWMFFLWTLGAMVWVTLARTPLEFLVAWETMGMMSFALVAFEYHEKSVLRAGWIYLLACHAGAAFLIPAFIFGGDGVWAMGAVIAGLIGFGLKIGFPLLHVWLPEAHPAAPAPVSAVMSGAMINLGFYGILRMPYAQDPTTLQYLGWILLGLGLIGAFGGILFATAQRNLKRLLAYSSIENMGIIGIGFGLGFLGAAYGYTTIAVTAFSGAFLHMLNHAALKSSLFLAAGSVLRSTGTLNMDRMGGLAKRMPKTFLSFLISALSLSGLPPFNGFLGELLIYVAAFLSLNAGVNALTGAGLPVLLILAMVGGLAAVAYVKALGAVFLGEPRTQAAADAEERPASMLLPLLIGGFFSCILLFSAPVLLPFFTDLTGTLVKIPAETAQPTVQALASILAKTAIFSVFFMVLAGLLLRMRKRDLEKKEEKVKPTWDCGYAEPTARMEYTGTAFVQPVVDFFSNLLHPVKKVRMDRTLFPKHAEISVETEDAADRTVWKPLFHLYSKAADKVHQLQSGYLHLYVLIMVLALLAMLIWGFYFEGGAK